MAIDPNELPNLDLNAVEQELRKEEKYGGRPLEAFAGQAASTASLGLSDAALVAAGVDPERLREVREREAEAKMAGTVTGVVAPALATLGTSTAAQAAALPARAFSTVGGIAERVAAKALPEGAARTIGAAAARGAAEGATAGAGELVSDVALQNRDLSAESVLGTVGTGALWGGGFGAAIGTAQAGLPAAMKGANWVGDKAKGIGKQAFRKVADPLEGALDTVAGNTSQKLKIRNRLGTTVEELPSYLTNDLQLNMGSTAEELATQNAKVIKQSGERIGQISKELDAQAAERGTPMTRPEAYERLKDKAYQLAEQIGPDTESAAGKLEVVEKYIKGIEKLQKQKKPTFFKQLDDLRMQYAGDAYRGDDPILTFKGDIADALRGELRNIVDDVAQYVNKDLAAELKVVNKRYHIGNAIRHPLEYSAEKAPDLSHGLIAFGAGVVGRGLRNGAIMYDVANKTNAFADAIGSKVADAFKVRMPKGTMTFPATSILVNSQMAMDPEGKKPKSKLQAFNNASTRLMQAATDPDHLVDLLAKKTARVSQADPETGMVLQQRLVNAVNFLNTKLPKPAISDGVFKRQWQPSSLELAKFERYVQIVEQPLTVLDELRKGTLTREHVEALQTVYPEVYKQIQLQVLNHINDGKVQLPYAKKLQIGILLNIPADSSLQPQTLLELQQNLQPQEPQQQPGVQFQPENLGKTGISERMESGSEALAKRD